MASRVRLLSDKEKIMSITEYFTPTHVYFGKNAEDKTGELISSLGARKVLVHFGSGSVKKSGLLDKVENDLRSHNIDYIELGGVIPNPRVSLVRKGVEIGRKEGVDFVLSVGGGSVVDSAKAICYGLFDEEKGEVWDFYEGKRSPKGSIPLGVLLTLSATGSEMSDSSVITNDEGGIKRGINTNFCRPVFSLLNPELTYTVSRYQTSCGTVDIMMHTLERFFHSGSTLALSDKLSLALIKQVMESGKIALDSPEDYDARANLMWAGSLSHNGLMNMGNETRGDWSCHQLEHELSGKWDVAHGAGLAAIWASWARYVYKANPERFAILGESLFGMERQKDIEAEALDTIERMEEYFRSVEMPTNLKELGIDASDADIEELAEKCTFFGKRRIGSFMSLGKDDMIAIYKTSRSKS